MAVQSTHFAIMSISSIDADDAEDSKNKSEILNNEYGVGPVFYEDPDNSHQGLDRILDEIDEECRVRSQSEADDVDWLEQVNQRM